MYSNDTKAQVAQLRAKGLSLARIATDLHVSQRTLVHWNRQLAPDVRALRAVHLEALHEQTLASREADLARLAKIQANVEAAITERDFTWVDSDKPFVSFVLFVGLAPQLMKGASGIGHGKTPVASKCPRQPARPGASSRSHSMKYGRLRVMSRLAPALLLVPLSAGFGPAADAAEPALGPSGPGQTAPPNFGPNVLVFDPAMTNIQDRLDAVFSKQEANQFGSNRYAYLFKPGQYDLDVQVGFYMQVLGLGRSPDDVSITGAVRSKARWMRGNATCNFWRSAENLSVTPTQDQKVNIWAVSQATALRRVHVKGALNLSDNGWSSGGFIADCKIDGQVNSGSQQQWFSRNAEWGSWKGGSWNMVFVGTVNPPAGLWPEAPYTVIEKTPLVREKPYLIIDTNGQYFVMVPNLQTHGTQGTTWPAGAASGTPIPIAEFYVARPGADSAASINDALDHGKHLLLTPGIYPLETGLRVTRPGTVVLGLGYPTLRPENGTPALVISDVDGVKVGGLLLEAGAANSSVLLQAGDPGSSISHAADPLFLYDICCRAGGALAGNATGFVTLNCNDVVGDNFWLWRADHGRGVGWTLNKNHTGLLVNGNNVTLYGLFVEHCQEYQTVWNGNRGRVYFYQSELPYDPPSQEAWRHGEVNGFASYKVGDGVTTHEAWGLGVYCVFHAAPVVADNAVETPVTPGVKLHHLVTIRLAGRPGSGINHVINGLGAAVISTRKAIVD